MTSASLALLLISAAGALGQPFTSSFSSFSSSSSSSGPSGTTSTFSTSVDNGSGPVQSAGITVQNSTTNKSFSGVLNNMAKQGVQSGLSIAGAGLGEDDDGMNSFAGHIPLFGRPIQSATQFAKQGLGSVASFGLNAIDSINPQPMLNHFSGGFGLFSRPQTPGLLGPRQPFGFGMGLPFFG